MYQIRILESAKRDLARLDKPVGRRIAPRIKWLGKNFDDVKPEAYTGDLKGLYKLRVGNYRIIYEIISKEQVLVIHQIDHRRDIYRKR